MDYRAKWLLGAWVTGVWACAHPASRRSGADPAGMALLAQVGGFGGCDSVDHRDTYHLESHPGLTFIAGTCVREHGDTARALVAVDDDNQVYLLGTPAGLDFMLRMRPVKPFGRAEALGYVAAALRMLGAIDASDKVVLSAASLPDTVLDRAGVKREELLDSSRVLRQLSRGYEVGLITLGPGGLTATIVIVYSDSGFVRVTSRRNWQVSDR